ncbi:MAG: 2OG-Fe(II) oxygenase [Halieaceae bacterium]|nr:2OG-Fe(II) oxygenase [Halieaceae bacterium]
MTSVAGSSSSLRISEHAEKPFRYFLADQCLDIATERALLVWFESDAPWRLVEKDFYEQYEFSLLDAPLPASLNSFMSSGSLTALRTAVENAFQRQLTDKIGLVAHKLTPGQRIAIHNDHLTGAESHRLTIQINRGLNDEEGGFFMLFNSFDANDVHRVLRPRSGSAIGFEISPASHHAVSRLYGGVRYSLIYSFHAVCHDTVG